MGEGRGVAGFLPAAGTRTNRTTSLCKSLGETSDLSACLVNSTLYVDGVRLGRVPERHKDGLLDAQVFLYVFDVERLRRVGISACRAFHATWRRHGQFRARGNPSLADLQTGFGPMTGMTAAANVR